MTDKSRRRLRRRLSAALLLLTGLAVAGGLAATLTPTPQVAVADESQSALLRTGKQLFDTSCVTCHGANLQGVPDRGPSLIGVGEAAVYFQVSTGRMPAMRGEAQAPRKDPIFDETQIDALGAYVQANGGGPIVPRDANGQIANESLLGSDVARGGDLFRLNCASCHNFTGKGGALSSGKYAPDLEPAEPAQIYTAMLSGPQNMPRFSDRQLTPDEKKDIVAYVHEATETPNPGGYGLGGFGPAPEGMAMWIIGMVAVIGAAVWIGARASAQPLTSKARTPPARKAFPGSQATPNWPLCPARSLSSSEANSTASRPSTRAIAGRFLAPRPRSGPSAQCRIGFCWAVLRVWRCCWCSCSGRGSTSRLARRVNSSTRWPRRCTV